MVRITDLDVCCDSCDDLVTPNPPENRLKYGLAIAVPVAVLGYSIGGTVGIATAGIGWAATYPFATLGAYGGWKLGIEIAEWRYDYTCPSCKSPFMGATRILRWRTTLEDSYRDIDADTPQSIEREETTNSAETETDSATTTSSDDPFGSDFTVGFNCGNCERQWEKSFASGTEISPADEGVSLEHPSKTGWIVCPTCKTHSQVTVRERQPDAQDPGDVSIAEVFTGVLAVVGTFTIGHVIEEPLLGLVAALTVFLGVSATFTLRALK